MKAPLLRVEKLVKRFGGLTATDNCSLDIFPGEICALIGPNGAGKTTLLAQLSGELPSDGGRTLFNGRDISRLPVHRRVAVGIARSYQITNLFARLSVRENLALAVQARAAGLLSQLEQETALLQAADKTGLLDILDSIAGTLSHGKQRALELGVTLACNPRLLLLDEPMAGTDPQESLRMGELIGALRGEHSIVLVEHDMEAVFRLADRICVLVAGHVIATGKPEQIRVNPEVIKAYLGDGDDEKSC